MNNKSNSNEKERNDWDLINLDGIKARKILQNIPQDKRIQIKFEMEQFIKSMNWAYIWITPWKCLPSGRISNEKVEIAGKKMKKITKTPCFMFLNVQVWGRGIINKPGIHCGNCFDLSTPKGLALILHEIYHIYQFRRNPIKLIWLYAQALRNSIVHDHVFFSHARIPFEIEAIAFEQELLKHLKQPKCNHFLKEIEGYR